MEHQKSGETPVNEASTYAGAKVDNTVPELRPGPSRRLSSHSNNSRANRSHGSKRSSRSVDLVMKEELNESSPLLKATRPSEDDIAPLSPLSSASSPVSDEWYEDQSQETKSSWYLFLLTLAIGGLQIAWSVELSYGSPYLLGLGISKSLLALVWIAGPLSGTLVQPYVGIKSDRSRSKWGKRRPFIVGGACATVLSLFCLAWAKDIVGGVLGVFGVDKEAQAVYTVSIIFAVSLIYILDFAINVIQAGVRAFIVDNAPTHQQNDANAWASRISGVGNILGYLSGYVNLPSLLPFFGNTQFKVLCVIASIALGSTAAISCFCITERDPRLEGEPIAQKEGVLAFFKGLYHAIRRLPPQISKVCQVQFFAWIGWFPFLFYTTTFIGEIYAEPFYAENPNMSKEEMDAVWVRGTREATFALLIFAFTTFSSSVVLPLLVQPTFQPPAPPLKTPMTPAPTTPASVSGVDYFASRALPSSLSFRSKRGFFKRAYNKLPSTKVPGLTLRRAYVASHVIFACLTWLTFFVHSTRSATILVAFIGIPWSVTNWAPFALIAAEISKREAIRRHQIRPPPTDDGQLLASGEDPADGADQAGVVLGIHNVAIAAPQVIATLVSSLIFRMLQKPRGSTGDDSVAWVLRFGGLAALVAAYLATKIGEERM